MLTTMLYAWVACGPLFLLSSQFNDSFLLIPVSGKRSQNHHQQQPSDDGRSSRKAPVQKSKSSTLQTNLANNQPRSGSHHGAQSPSATNLSRRISRENLAAAAAGSSPTSEDLPSYMRSTSASTKKEQSGKGTLFSGIKKSVTS